MKPDFSTLRMTLVLVPHDMRCGYFRLSMLARDWLSIDVSLGRDVVVFISRSGGIAKLLWADDKGSNLLTRKLRSGCFQRLAALKNAAPGQRLTKAELMAYLDGKSYQEIAVDLERHVKSIDNALQRVKRKLERYMELNGNEIDIGTIYRGLTAIKRRGRVFSDIKKGEGMQ